MEVRHFTPTGEPGGYACVTRGESGPANLSRRDCKPTLRVSGYRSGPLAGFRPALNLPRSAPVWPRKIARSRHDHSDGRLALALGTTPDTHHHGFSFFTLRVRLSRCKTSVGTAAFAQSFHYSHNHTAVHTQSIFFSFFFAIDNRRYLYLPISFSVLDLSISLSGISGYGSESRN